MKENLMRERQHLCQNLPYLQGINWAAAVCRINRIDDLLERMGADPEPMRRITLEYSPDEAQTLADALECLARAVRKGARSERAAGYLSAHPDAKITIGSEEYVGVQG